MLHLTPCLNPDLLTILFELIGPIPETLDADSFAQFEHHVHQNMSQIKDLCVEMRLKERIEHR